jgi:hypothetical protein
LYSRPSYAVFEHFQPTYAVRWSFFAQHFELDNALLRPTYAFFSRQELLLVARSTTGSLLTQEIAYSCYNADRWLCPGSSQRRKHSLMALRCKKFPSRQSTEKRRCEKACSLVCQVASCVTTRDGEKPLLKVLHTASPTKMDERKRLSTISREVMHNVSTVIEIEVQHVYSCTCSHF